jgi:hypothetical protein
MGNKGNRFQALENRIVGRELSSSITQCTRKESEGLGGKYMKNARAFLAAKDRIAPQLARFAHAILPRS